MKFTRASVYHAYVTAVTVLFVGLGLLGLLRSAPEGNGLPGGAVVQQGQVVEGQQAFDHFNDNVVIDTTQVAPK